LDFSVLANNPALRMCAIVALCAFGFFFGFTDVGLDGTESVDRRIFLNDCQIFLVD